MATLFKFRADRVLDSGECVIVGYETDSQGNEKKNGKAHGETVFCKVAHTHSKTCAQTLIDAPMTPEVKDPDTQMVITPAGLTPRQSTAAWFAALDARVEPKAVALPTKTVKEKNDKGVLVDKVVEDKDLT